MATAPDLRTVEIDSVIGRVGGKVLLTLMFPRTRVFYCDPRATNQKARIERNHEFIRIIRRAEVSAHRC